MSLAGSQADTLTSSVQRGRGAVVVPFPAHPSRYRTMPGLQMFSSLKAAIDAGFQIKDPHYEITPGRYGMLVRQKTQAGWVRALVLPGPTRGDAA